MKINILIPGDFRTSKNDESVKCSYKVQDGYLYPLKSSMMFIHKPVIYLKLTEIKFAEFSRIGGSGTNKSFDIIITKLADDS
jgi:structure-specific recognition protein 1